MFERMVDTANLDPAKVEILINETPVKTAGGEVILQAQLLAQAEVVRGGLAPVDYFGVRGTCIDERPRDGSEPRPAVPGGPVIYALVIGELLNLFESSPASGPERLHSVHGSIAAKGIRSGGHYRCAASGGVPTWLRVMAENPETMYGYGRLNLGKNFDERLAEQVLDQARHVVKSGRYDSWNEDVLQAELKPEGPAAMERLLDVPHEGLTVARNRLVGWTINQTQVYEHSVLGKGTYDMDDEYARVIEHALIDSLSDTDSLQPKAAHARQFIVAAVAGVVPNEELYQLTLQ